MRPPFFWVMSFVSPFYLREANRPSYFNPELPRVRSLLTE
jgi:hypothetical protein